MIPHLDIRDKYTLKTVALVEPQECWLELSYQDIGEFEIYCRASKANLNALQKGRYVTIPNKRFIWVITSVQYTYTAGGARMISAKGYEAKWLLSKRCILTPKELSGNITSAVYGLVDHALGTGANAARTISDNNGNHKFYVDTNELLIDISGTQAPRGNLWEFVNPLLKIYNCGSIVELIDGVLKYRIFTGNVKTQSVKFSQSLDNLLSSSYLTDDAQKATNALVVSSFDETYTVGEEEHKRTVDYLKEVDKGATGIDRAEIVVESDLSTKYEDANGVEQETAPDSELYQCWQEQEGTNKLAEHITIEEVSGEIDIANSNYIFDEHFFLGDMVRAQEEYFNFYVNAKISKYTFKQDANGYGEEAEYGG
jgi:hypothetical protein